MKEHTALWNQVMEYLDRRNSASAQDASCIQDVHFLLRHGFDVNTTDEKGETLLHKCRDFHQLTYILLLNGANVNLQDAEGNTPFHDCQNLTHSHILWYMGQAGVDLQITNKHGISRYDNIQKLAEETPIGADLKRQADKIVAGKMIWAVHIPQSYYPWLESMFSAKVIAVTTLETQKEIPENAIVLVNADHITTDEIKSYQANDLSVSIFFVTLQQLKYCQNYPYWGLLCSEAHCQMLSHVNSFLHACGLRCVREKFLFSNGSNYWQTSLWENTKGNYFVPTLEVSNKRDDQNAFAFISIEGFHDDVFVREGIIPLNVSLESLEKDILHLIE